MKTLSKLALIALLTIPFAGCVPVRVEAGPLILELQKLRIQLRSIDSKLNRLGVRP